MDFVDLVADWLAPGRGGVLIDVGCGEGHLIGELLPHLRPSLSVGVDIDRQSLGGWAEGVCADAAQLPLRNGVADVVTARGLLHHVDDVEQVIDELARVVAPNGWLFVSDATQLDAATFAEMNRELEAAGLPAERHPGFEPDRLVSRISGCGLSVTHTVIAGEATFATPPFVSRVYSTTRLIIGARR